MDSGSQFADGGPLNACIAALEATEPSLGQRLHPIRELESLALIRPGALWICRVPGAFELRLNYKKAIADTVVHQGIDTAVISAVGKRPDPNRIFRSAQSANGGRGERTRTPINIVLRFRPVLGALGD